MVAGGDEGAVDAEFVGDFEIVERIADEKNLVRWQPEAGDECTPERGFTVGVDVVEAVDVGEVSGYPEVGDDFAQGFAAVGRENRLVESGARD